MGFTRIINNLPDGDYKSLITAAQFFTSKKGNELFKINFKIEETGCVFSKIFSAEVDPSSPLIQLTEKNILKTVAIFSDCKSHRYLLAKQWDKDKPTACVIMLYPGTSDGIQTDLTTTLVVDNVAKLGFGEVQIVNLYSLIGQKGFDENSDAQILKSCKNCDSIIIAWGSLGKTNKAVARRQQKVVTMLAEHREKMFQIDTGLHPLAPQARKEWVLKKFEFPPELMPPVE